MKDKIIAWLEAAPPGLTVRFRNMDLTKSLTVWKCFMGRGSRSNLAGSEYTADQIVDGLDLFRVPAPPAPDPNIWICGDGRTIRIDKLDDDHLVNVCKWLRKRIVGLYRQHLQALYLSIDPDDMGEHAYDAAMMEQDDLMDRMDEAPDESEHIKAAEWHPQAKLLVAEIRRRKLEDRLEEPSLVSDLDPA